MYQRWPSDYVKTRFKNVTVNHFVHTQKQYITPEFILILYTSDESCIHTRTVIIGPKIARYKRNCCDYGARRLQDSYIPVTGVARRSQRQRKVPGG